MATTENRSEYVSRLLNKVTCPNCWEVFEPCDICWISEADDLVGDFLLGETEHERFLPMKFDDEGHAIDRKGYPCREYACPRCHLRIPAPVLEMRPFFISIVGAPASGKSYFLASMTMQMKQTFPKKFFVDVADADPLLNQRLTEYESLLGEDNGRGTLKKIDKTEEQGDLYNTILRDGQQITYPQPFIFKLSPLPDHKFAAQRQKVSTSLCLYDNAGESYLPLEGAGRSSLPVTQHLGRSNCIFFLFDPLQDHRFREKCRAVSSDPQLQENTAGDFRKSPIRQEQILNEMIKRTRSYRNMTSTEQYKQPVVVIVTKVDAWHKLVPELPYRQRLWTKDPNTEMRVLYEDQIKKVSQITRKFLNDYIPQIVSNVESFASNVTYIPVSATGTSPRVDPQTHESGFQKVQPFWVEIPILYALSKSTQGIIPIQ